MSRWLPAITGHAPGKISPKSEVVIGVLPGEGVGPDLTQKCVQVLEATSTLHGFPVQVLHGPSGHGDLLTADVRQFHADVFARGGAVLSGAVGGRFVYDLRRDFDLYCKLVPVRPWRALLDNSPLRPEHVRDVDIMIVRENSAGLYQGVATVDGEGDERRVVHSFEYSQAEVSRIVRAAAALAAGRRGRLAVVYKAGGLPTMSRLWREAGEEAAASFGVETSFVDIDLCAYELVSKPASFDVIVAPNTFGDILADISALLLGGRGVSFSGNYAPSGNAVYQTNHGAAFDLVGADAANPVGQISSLAMLLRESAGMPAAARTIDAAIKTVWNDGWRTRDVAGPTHKVIGTSELVARIVDAIDQMADEPEPDDAELISQH
ncbi:isocitrate/isopropylmalate family dehydrogenase [Smaragdicoccus niigatensis]|uniref:isocitrate/isopropylmalate family dehydrogenase n=1 Tax=Smaragdicoccus niigatensis TaxID=359359 RepID=UPI000373F013|nr:isocitrate/isopropylmalate family dehydrogenase [Smaragdicoccus niigatensis]